MSATAGAFNRKPGSALSKAVRYGGALLGVCVGLLSYRYIVQVGPVPANVLANRFFDHWIVVHAGAASTALILGAMQLSSVVRQRWRGLHRASGRVYVASCIAGGASAMVLAAGVSTGPVAAWGFGALGTLWLYATMQGLRSARARDFSRHRAWMIRSYALTFAAVTLRIYLPLSQIIGIDFAFAYRCIAWLAWVPNMVIAEIYLRQRGPGLRAGSQPLPAPSCSSHTDRML
ncbi:DUF2306 domain-containing protein [Herbaspirillum sp. SJZ107]|uniref:DUF2306 domain-containing protein n=1 Tax=Herbaspirillum sp. SJZ107 TaxID=2572881 RepID=UPI001154D814|nr:DUF2306 domain-containing protein [Herbaspirillum sp. SJZ107]TQK03525.1 putative membrane protein [Herbaspirillum sp. SJZ107]